MKVLVATTQTQGARDDDFSRTVSGELVFDGGPCSGVAEDEDWDCECSIAFRGVASGELTTTAIVTELPITPPAYEQAFCDGLGRVEFCEYCARVCAHDAWLLAMRWPIGTVIERDQRSFSTRSTQ